MSTSQGRPCVFTRTTNTSTTCIHRPFTAPFQFVINDQVKRPTGLLFDVLKEAAAFTSEIPGSELSIWENQQPSGKINDVVNITIRVPVDALGKGGTASLIKMLQEELPPTHCTDVEDELYRVRREERAVAGCNF